MTNANPKAAADLIRAAGGQLVGRTKQQKCACLLDLAGVGYGFQFSYRHFGPYSEELQIATDDADALGLIKEHKRSASWGGWYSVFTYEGPDNGLFPTPAAKSRVRRNLLKVAADADPIELELAVTAAFLASKGVATPWDAVATRKPSKATEKCLARSQDLYRKLLRVTTPKPLPRIVSDAA